MSHSDFCVESLHLTCCSETAKLVIVVKIIEDTFMCGWLFFLLHSAKIRCSRKFKLLGLKKMWFILNHSEADWTKPAATILVLLVEAFCPYLGNFSKEIKAVSLLQLKVAVVHQLLCVLHPYILGLLQQLRNVLSEKNIWITSLCWGTAVWEIWRSGNSHDTERKLCSFLPAMQRMGF